MTKKTNKILLTIILFISIILLKSSYAFASATAEQQTQAFNEFVKKDYKSSYTLYLGEKMDAVPFSISDVIDVNVKSSNSNVVSTKYNSETHTHELQGKKIGKSNITVTAKYNGKTETKKFTITVETTTTSTKLDSSTNDVVSITSVSKKQTEVLLANNELWDTNSTTFKLSKKATGNVSKYVYTDVYQNYAYDKGYYKIALTAMLKKDNTLLLDNFDQTFKASNVKEISNSGYLTKNGKYYQYVISKDGKLTSEKVLDNVSYLVKGLVVKKDGKTYATSGKKIFDFKATDASDFSQCGYGLVLNSKGNIYYYEYDFKINKYVTKKVASNAKSLLNNYQYITNSGEIKKVVVYEHWDYYDTSLLKSVYLYNRNAYNLVTLKTNNKLYLNGVKILDKVDNIYYANGTKNTICLIVRKDGSIWRLRLNGNSSLVKLRSGKDSNKKISKPTNLSASKSDKNNVKLKWNKVEGASKYTIYRATSKNGTYKKIGTSKTNSYTNKKVTIGKTYYYKVVANHSNSDFNSSRSSSIKIKIPKTPTKVKATKKSKTSLKVTYKKVSGVSGYEIRYSTNKNFKKYSTKTTKKTSYTIKKLKKNKTYYVKVRSYQTINGKKVYSSFSSSTKVKLK